MIDPSLMLMLISYLPSLLILSFFFSSFIGTRVGSKSGLSRQGLLTSFAGLSLATVLSVSSPIIPSVIPVLDVAVILAAGIWIILLRRFCKTSWLETLPQAILPVITYVVILAISAAFTLLIIS